MSIFITAFFNLLDTPIFHYCISFAACVALVGFVNVLFRGKFLT